MLASSCTSVKLWNLSNYNLIQEIKSTGGNVSSLSWNKDGQFLASLCPDSSEISLHAVTSLTSASTVDVFKILDRPQCIQFARKNSQYLAIGGSRNSIVVRDIKEKLRKRQYTLSEDSLISRLCFNYVDSHLGVSTTKGEIYFCSISNNSISGPLKLFGSESRTTDTQFSNVNRSLIGATGECGSVSLVDANAMKVLKRICGSHNAPISSLRFSPTNDLLMATVGYDKKFVTYNVNTKRASMSKQTSEPLTSLCFMADGQSVALGTMTGQILFYDLRALTHPKRIIDVDRSSVNDISLMPVSKKLTVSKSVSSSSNKVRNVEAPKKEQLSQRSLQPPSLPIQRRSPFSSPNRSASVISPSLQILSPIKHSDNVDLALTTNIEKDKWIGRELLSLSPSKSLNEQNRTGSLSFRNYSFSNNSSSKRIDLDDDDILSPVKVEQSSPVGSTSSSVSPLKPTLGMNMGKTLDDLLSPVRSISSQDSRSCSSQLLGSPSPPKLENLNMIIGGKSTFSNLETKVHRDLTNIAITVPEVGRKINPQILCDSNISNISLNIDSIGSKIVESVSNWNVSNKENVLTVESERVNSNDYTEVTLKVKGESTSRSLDCATHPPDKVNEIVSSNVPPGNSVNSGTLTESIPSSNINLDLVRNLVRNELNDHQTEVNSKFMDMQYVMIKSLYSLKKELKQEIEKNSLNQELLEENQMLREENDRLRLNY